MELTDQTIDMVLSEPTLTLFYDSTAASLPWLVQLMEYMAGLCNYEHHPVSITALDAFTYLDTASRYVEYLPSIVLFLGGIPICYTGPCHLGNLHIWLKAQLYTNSCSVASPPTPYPTPAPTSGPR